MRRAMLTSIFLLAFQGVAWAPIVDLPYEGTTRWFINAIRSTDLFSNLSAEEQDIALKGAAVWFYTIHCREPVAGVVREVFDGYAPLGDPTTISGRLAPYRQAQMMILGLLLQSTNHHRAGPMCRLAGEIVAKRQ